MASVACGSVSEVPLGGAPPARSKARQSSRSQAARLDRAPPEEAKAADLQVLSDLATVLE